MGSSLCIYGVMIGSFRQDLSFNSSWLNFRMVLRFRFFVLFSSLIKLRIQILQQTHNFILKRLSINIMQFLYHGYQTISLFCPFIIIIIDCHIIEYQLNQIQNMLNLEQDLLSAKNQIISILTEYEKSSEEKIISEQTIRFINLLQVIDSFDINKIKECQTHFKEDTIVRIIQSICEKIKNNQETKHVKQEPKAVKVEQPKAKIETKRQPRIASKSQQKSSEGGLFAFVRNKFTSKQKKATQMILPDEEPKCYYDAKTKSWIFQGQEPQVPKQIPKPPSAAERKSKQQIKKKIQPESELSQLTAPPSFQRKSKSGNTNKAKPKIAQKIQMPLLIDEPLSFAKVMQTINIKYQSLFSKIKSGSYERHIQLQPLSNGNFSQYIEFSERTLEISEQISNNQNKLIEKWGKILASDNKQIKIMQKVIKEISDSSIVSSEVLKIIETVSYKQKIIEVFVSKNIDNPKISQIQQQTSPKEQKYLSQQQQRQLLQLRNKLSSYQQKQSLIVSSSLMQQKQLQSVRDELIITKRTSQDQSVYIQKLSAEVDRLRAANKQLSDQLAMSSNDLNARYEATKDQLAETTIKMNAKINNMNTRIKELQNQNQVLKNQKRQLEINLSHERGLSKSSIQKVNTQITVQKSKIQAQLKFYQQRQKEYLKRLKNQSERDAIIRESELSLNQQNQLLISILQKRLQLSKVAEPQQFGLLNKFYIEPPQKSIILQLSDIVSSITETHLDRLEIFNRSYSKLHKKYQESKEALSRIKSNSVNQNMSLNRSVTKLKSLLETYKIGKEQAEQKCLQMQIQCEKLRKKLHHYKQQDQFNKSYLSRLKSSKINTSQNQSMISLQQDKEQLATQISDLQKQLNQKDELIQKGQKDLQDLLINYQKNQAKLFQVEKKYKESEREARAVREIKEDYENKIKMLELKLKNQKDRYDQIVNREESRLKNTENNFEKRLNLLKNSLQQSFEREKNLKTQIEQIKTEHQRKINQLSDLHKGIQLQLSASIKQKQQQFAQILLLLQQSNHDLKVQKQQKQILKRQLADLIKTQKQLKSKMSQLVNQHLKEISIHEDTQRNTNNMIQAILQKYKSFKRQQEQFTSQYEQKIQYLQQSLLSSQTQSAELLQQLNQYTSHIQSLTLHTTQLQKMKKKQQFQHTRKLSHMQQQNNNLKADISSLKQQNLQFEQIIQKMSQDYSRLKSSYDQLSKDKIDADEKLMYKDRQLQTYTNQNNKKSQQLMIKTEQLQERDKLMLDREELLVMKTEEMDQIKNQLQKAHAELADRDRNIKQLESNIEQLVNQLDSLQNNNNKLGNSLDLVLLQSQINHLKNDLNQRNIQFNNNIQTITLYEHQIAEKDRTIYDLTKQIQDFKKNESDLISTLNSLQQEHQQSLKQVERLKNEKDMAISNVNQLQNRLGLKQSEVILLQQKVRDLQKLDIKQVDKNQEIEQEMKCLLLSIEEKENEIQIRKVELKHKEKQIVSLNQAIKQAQIIYIGIEQERDSLKQKLALNQKNVLTYQDTIRTINRQNDELRTLVNKEEDKNYVYALRIEQIEKQKQQLTVLIQNLQNELDKEKQSQEKKDIIVSQLAYDDVQLLQQLNNQCQQLKTINKDQQIANKQQQQEIKDLKGLLASLDQQKQAYLSQLQQLKKKSGSISEKDSYIQQLQAQNQQMEKQLEEKDKKILQLEGNLTDMAQIIENLEERLNSHLAVQNNDTKGNSINQEINQKDNEISVLKKKIQQIKAQFVQKEKAYENKIQVLEKDIIGLNSLKSANKRLQDNHRALEDENKLLVDEKIELIKSNNYLVSINQKLIADKSPHTSNNPKQSKIHHPVNTNTSSQKTTQKVEVKQQPKTEKTQAQTKSQQKVDPPSQPQPQQQPAQTKGFFGTLSSLFLTPTQSNRLKK